MRQWINDYGMEQTVSVSQAFLQETPVTIRTNLLKITPEALEKRLKEEGVTAEKMVCADMPELNYAFMISGFDHLNALASFREGFLCAGCELHDGGRNGCSKEGQLYY